ncbi:MAG: F0F1 ATP synthase subunit B [Actinomycetota bacterium]|nr:F0F1 ATP synthase subunit B [Actinomycetota bacterium]MDQ3732571.1 F0F1 ATP synthase subunit B [Actinomycetota bacterium]
MSRVVTSNLLAQEESGNNFLVPDLTIIVEILAFLLILYILRRYVWPHLSKAMNDRQAMIRQMAEDAAAATAKLKEAEERYNAALAEARTEAAVIRDQARADAQAIREELKDKAEAEAERIRVRADEQIAGQREQVVRQLRSEVGGLAFQLAERIVGESLADDARLRHTVDSFLDDIDDLPTKEERQTTSTSVGGAG